MKNYFNINDWYYTRYNKETRQPWEPKTFIVAIDYPNEMTGKMSKRFAYFSDVGEFWRFYSQLQDKHIYETISGDVRQKIKFDIDISRVEYPTVDDVEWSLIISTLVDGIVTISKRWGHDMIVERDILLCTSSNDKKYSAHIITPRICVDNNLIAKKFYHEVIEVIPLEYRKYIDDSVYSSNQQFRMLFSRKLGTDLSRTKEAKLIWTYRDKEIVTNLSLVKGLEIYGVFLASLITYTSDSTILSDPNPIAPSLSIKKTEGDYENINLSDAGKAYKLLKTLYPKTAILYRIGDVNTNMINLIRLRRGLCEVCNRSHDNENAYIQVMGEERHCFFVCRRGEGKLYLGQLEGTYSIDNLEEKLEAVKLRDSPMVPDLSNPFSKSSIIRPPQLTKKDRYEIEIDRRERLKEMERDERSLEIKRLISNPIIGKKAPTRARPITSNIHTTPIHTAKGVTKGGFLVL